MSGASRPNGYVIDAEGWLARTESGAPVSPEAVSGTCRA
jgi:hypothetical protein